ncbi:MAG TPA: ATP synthase F1 subunit delta [Puia sp.]|nr:ATP synthase F1 subunit delta [Puia sp.]
MPNPRLAGRYAKSLIDLSVEKNQLDAVYADMLFLERVCKNNRDFVNLLKSPIITTDKKENIFDAIALDHIGALTASFNKLLIKKGREIYLPEIVTAFIEQYKSYKGIHIVNLITAVPASDELKNSLTNKIKSALKIEHIELNTAVNPDIIGGFVLEIGDKLVDASVAFELHNIRKEFESNDFVYRIR